MTNTPISPARAARFTWNPEDFVIAKSEQVAKDGPTAGDVHVDAPLGSNTKKPKRKVSPMAEEDFTYRPATVAKVDAELGLVFGWAIVSKVGEADYYDVQGDHIPEDSMLKAAADFMKNSRSAKDMHAGDEIGKVLFAFPLTTEIAKAMGLGTKVTGLMIAMQPPPEVLAKFRDGTYTGFSIGGRRLQDEIIEE